MEQEPTGVLLLETGPPISLKARFVDGAVVKEMKYAMTHQQAAELGSILLRLSGATEARAEGQAIAASDAAFLKSMQIGVQ